MTIRKKTPDPKKKPDPSPVKPAQVAPPPAQPIVQTAQPPAPPAPVAPPALVAPPVQVAQAPAPAPKNMTPLLVVIAAVFVIVTVILLTLQFSGNKAPQQNNSNVTSEQVQEQAKKMLDNMTVEQRQKYFGLTSTPPPASASQLEMNQYCNPCGNKKPGPAIRRPKPTPRRDPLPTQTADNGIQNTVPVPVNVYVTSTCEGGCRTGDTQPPAVREREFEPVRISENPPAPVQTHDIVETHLYRYKYRADLANRDRKPKKGKK